MERWLKSNLVRLAGLVLVVAGLSGCGKGTTISSPALNTGGAGIVRLGFGGAYSAMSVFRICVGSIRLENESGDAQGGDELGEITFQPGLIDLSDGQETVWGSVELPVDFVLKTIKIYFKTNPEICGGADWSVNFNNVTTTEEMEAKWTVSTPQVFSAGDQIRIPLQAMVDALLVEVGNGTLDSSTLKQAIQAAEDTFELQQ